MDFQFQFLLQLSKSVTTLQSMIEEIENLKNSFGNLDSKLQTAFEQTIKDCKLKENDIDLAFTFIRVHNRHLVLLSRIMTLCNRFHFFCEPVVSTESTENQTTNLQNTQVSGPNPTEPHSTNHGQVQVLLPGAVSSTNDKLDSIMKSCAIPNDKLNQIVSTF